MLSLLFAFAQGATIDFEDVGDPIVQHAGLPAGYGGFTWSHPAHWMFGAHYPGSGYDVGTRGSYALFTAWSYDIEMAAPEPFDLDGLWMTAAWDPTEVVVIEGWSGGTLLYTETVTVRNDVATWLDLDLLDVTRVLFRPDGNQIVMDDLTWHRNAAPVALVDALTVAVTDDVTLQVDPSSINLRSGGTWVTGWLAPDLEGDALLTLSALASDPDGDPLTYAWTVTADDGTTWLSEDAEPELELPVGSYTVTLVVGDGRLVSAPVSGALEVVALDPTGLDPTRLTLNGVAGAAGTVLGEELGVKFSRAQVAATLSLGWQTVRLGGDATGTDQVRGVSSR